MFCTLALKKINKITWYKKYLEKVAQFRELQITYTTLSNSKNRLTQFTIKRYKRGEGEKTRKKKKKILETHRNSDSNTTGIVGKILTSRIQL